MDLKWLIYTMNYDQGYPNLKKECDRWVGARHIGVNLT